MQSIKNIFTVLKNFFTEHSKIVHQQNIFMDDAKKTIRENDTNKRNANHDKVIDDDGIITMNKPEVIEPEAVVSKVIEPEAVVSKVVAPEAVVSEVVEPEVSVPEVVEPEVSVPEVVEPEVSVPEVVEPEAVVSEVVAPEAMILK
ncbi:hypothetical protein FK949_gp028 [Paramecium bursaria Chlorella virus NYs1]|uniref:Uncharacterized protein n=1 Tax=Paramecium bursaria Chlorella virus NYs1 TaxID=83442 RepID=M1HH48_9PHYC|nr:hypothetical protein FK949_gp028 [Paramecium bursaria Chlorella virus NYs1]AGE54964.1 hypothetical protein PBCVMA1D_557R [Paramecium bursaria Chlorella virus MA1D]AGE58593.1 hypothetical protein PBCVNYs1_076L [Paramecium bursaria Chlorella virus NYs1]